MSLSVASSAAAAYGKPFAFGLVDVSTAAATGAEAPKGLGLAPPWRWTPTSTGAWRSVTPSALLPRVPALDADDVSGSSQASGAPHDALSSALNQGRAMPTGSTGASPSAIPQQIDRLQDRELTRATPSAGTVASSSSTASQDETSADGLAAAAEVKLEALFKTLQAYGL